MLVDSVGDLSCDNQLVQKSRTTGNIEWVGDDWRRTYAGHCEGESGHNEGVEGEVEDEVEVEEGVKLRKRKAGIPGPLIGRACLRASVRSKPQLFFLFNFNLQSSVFNFNFRDTLNCSGGLPPVANCLRALRLQRVLRLLFVYFLPILPSTHTMASNAGITTDATTGERFIPSSVRADGTKRREIKIKPGYKPPEDVELYKNRAAAAWKTRGRGGVPGAESVSSEDDKAAQTAASNKNAKRREAKRKSKETEAPTTATEKKGAESENWRVPAPKKDEQPAEDPVDVEAEKEKKARNLKKKLRQARDLKEKKTQGEALLPEQLDKVIKIQELVRQLDILGFDSNGDKREDSNNESV